MEGNVFVFEQRYAGAPYHIAAVLDADFAVAPARVEHQLADLVDAEASAESIDQRLFFLASAPTCFFLLAQQLFVPALRVCMQAAEADLEGIRRQALTLGDEPVECLAEVAHHVVEIALAFEQFARKTDGQQAE